MPGNVSPPGNIGGTAYICADKKTSCVYCLSLLQMAKEEEGDSVKSGWWRFQVLKSGISILITFHLNYFQQVGICQDQSESLKEKEVNSPERCDKNRKLVCAREQWRPQLGCSNGGNYIKTGLERTVYVNTAGRRSSPPSIKSNVSPHTSGTPHTVTDWRNLISLVWQTEDLSSHLPSN